MSINWSDILTEATRILLGLVIPALAAWVLAQLAASMPRLKAWYEQNFNQTQRAIIDGIVRVGVLMVEQLYSRPDIQMAADQKREIAFRYITEQLNKYGIKMSATEIYDMIEAAVYQHTRAGGTLVAVAPDALGPVIVNTPNAQVGGDTTAGTIAAGAAIGADTAT